MRKAGYKVMVMQGFFKAIERAAYTDGKAIYAKIKGNVWEIRECGKMMKYNETTCYMEWVPCYDTVRLVSSRTGYMPTR